METLVLLSTLILCCCPFGFAQEDELKFEDDIIFSDLNLDLNVAPRRVRRQVKTMLTKETKPHMTELSVKTTIISRYAFTAVYCKMFNRHSSAAEGTFHFQIPAAAYVSNFTMMVGGRVFPSQIKPREKKAKQGKNAEKEPPTAKPKNTASNNQSEGDMETFKMAVKIPGRNFAVFMLTYEELLQRRLGYYEHVTSVRPLQLVSRLTVEVTIVEHSPVTHLEVLPLRNGKTSSAKAALPISTVVQRNNSFCRVKFNPSIVQQARLTTTGILGDFVVRYDVEREMGIGDIQVLDGYFVHYFAPRDLPVVPKNVVFVIDTSASMLGTKMRQTKEALFTILRDLGPNDRFNFVSFSNRVRVWQPGKLVPVTPLNVRDAKKFIYMITPTGGTDINSAFQSGSSLLNGFLSSPEAASNHNSVSLIIFLTDGRPTSGELQTASILANAQRAVDERFCVFTIGMGDDVDYRLLDRMALENCGMMRRIPEEADARSLLKGFYDEIGTPLLSDIHVEYSEDQVEYVTQHLFTNYFNGSEIVIAGKLTNRSADTLHVQVTASNSDRSIVMEKDVPLRQRELETERRMKAAGLLTGAGLDAVRGIATSTGTVTTTSRPSGADSNRGTQTDANANANAKPGANAKPDAKADANANGKSDGKAGTSASESEGSAGYIERLWGFMSVKDGLRSRMRSHTSRERDEHTRQATGLSLAYNFLTPLTDMTVEKPQVLADGTLATEATPTQPPATANGAGAANELPEEVEEEEEVGGASASSSSSSQSLTRKKEQPGKSSKVSKATGSAAAKRPSKKSVTKISKTSADGDPHFVVEFPLSKLTVCFNINGEPGHVLRLVTDHAQSGVTVNGKLIGAPPPPGSHKQLRTYFSTITIVADKPRRSYIEVTPKKVILDGRDRMVLPCDKSVSVKSGDLAVVIVASANVTVTIRGTIGFVILLHRYKNPAPYQRDHLGFYIGNSKGLSKDTHGLLGQFLNEEVGLVELSANATKGTNVATGQPTAGGATQSTPLPPRTALKVKGRTVPVVKKSRRIYSGRQTVDCWFARNNAAKLIDGDYGNYVVSHMFDTGSWPHAFISNTD
ncbi:inter-alpha-trypsin inhibitor heavy chain H5 isoform X2 [Alosa sapidissima]|uniref:inter-alpha-trypsin inhibitor heavy chain H5 isoform X2 n=1 Tax=Alosa sapidissima TaxID=34773 RepID=UPI001C083BB4|nr:inter-alpha-trypsin inhibitor heavy chain H5 isoform X2 [Alosa sapidissima]